MILNAVEFLRRFFLHTLPKGFVRIRHYGLLSDRFRNRLLPLAHKLLAADAELRTLALPAVRSPIQVIQRFTPAQLCQYGLPACSTHASPSVSPDDAATRLQDHVHRHPGTA